MWLLFDDSCALPYLVQPGIVEWSVGRGERRRVARFRRGCYHA